MMVPHNSEFGWTWAPWRAATFEDGKKSTGAAQQISDRAYAPSSYPTPGQQFSFTGGTYTDSTQIVVAPAATFTEYVVADGDIFTATAPAKIAGKTSAVANHVASSETTEITLASKLGNKDRAGVAGYITRKDVAIDVRRFSAILIRVWGEGDNDDTGNLHFIGWGGKDAPGGVGPGHLLYSGTFDLGTNVIPAADPPFTGWDGWPTATAVRDADIHAKSTNNAKVIALYDSDVHNALILPTLGYPQITLHTHLIDGAGEPNAVYVAWRPISRAGVFSSIVGAGLAAL